MQYVKSKFHIDFTTAIYLSINASIDAMNLTMQQFFGNIPNAFQQQILSLIAATILGINTKFDVSNTATTTCHLMYDDDNGIPKLRYKLDIYWEHIPLIHL